MNAHPRTPAGSALTDLVLDLFRLSSRKLVAGDRLVADLGLTSARWQILGAIVEAARPQPVAWLARDLGTNRQNVQRIVHDLEKEGLAELLRRPRARVDVLQAPHHGSARLDVAGLLRWCEPKLVVSSQGPPRSAEARRAYEERAGALWATHDHGAVTVRSRAGALEVEAFRTGRRLALR